ncbi:(dimethylallyl)adenosine tRNA methylthiotransferase [Perkinsela sp. CCAP 1560/4]|nr:(dimethylallyl)adenosine tRNA methylthiotransferase [Perkinsela sp. CCAP 1560/4]|eukprot:KNH03784.1 (dimethylallyl)adenosine tRNA methylthiotransferase [Perkinsela sp. CCAP 1560/4]
MYILNGLCIHLSISQLFLLKMSSLEEVISILRPRKGDQTNLIPVKSKVAQDALIYNAQTSHLLNPASSKPGKSLNLSYPYYKVVHTDSFVGDDMIPESGSKPLYEYVHLPTVRMRRWIELSAERKRLRSQQQIKKNFLLRRLHEERDTMHSFDEILREKNDGHYRVNPSQTDHDVFVKLETESVEPVHRAVEEKKPANRELARRYKPIEPKAIVMIHDNNGHTISTSILPENKDDREARTIRANSNLPTVSGKANQENSHLEGVHRVRPSQTNVSQDNLHADVKFIDKNISRFPETRKRENSTDPQSNLAAVQDILPSRAKEVESYLKEVHSHRISTAGTLDLDDEQNNIQANYQKLTKNLVSSGMLHSSSVQCKRVVLPMNCYSRFGEDELSVCKKISASDGRVVYLGHFAGSSKGNFFVLYQWHKGASWEASRAWKALQIFGIPKCCTIHQYLNGSHSFMGSAGQPSERHCTYAETGFTMIKSTTPLYALKYFISRQAPEAVMRAIFYQLFARYRALAFKRIVHYFLSPETIFIAIDDQNEKQELSVFPLLWDYSIDRVMFTDRKAQFISTRDSDLGLYTDSDSKPYEGFFADLLAMHGLLAKCCPEAIKCLQLLTEKISAYKDGADGYGFTVTPSFFTLLQSELDCDVEAIQNFLNTSNSDPIA